MGLRLEDLKRKRESVSNVSHLQREVYWIILLVMFFIEREIILDTLFFILGEIFKYTQ